MMRRTRWIYRNDVRAGAYEDDFYVSGFVGDAPISACAKAGCRCGVTKYVERRRYRSVDSAIPPTRDL